MKILLSCQVILISCCIWLSIIQNIKKWIMPDFKFSSWDCNGPLITRIKPCPLPILTLWVDWETEKERKQRPGCSHGKGLLGSEVAPRQTAKLAQNTLSHSVGWPCSPAFTPLPPFSGQWLTTTSVYRTRIYMANSTDVLLSQRLDQLREDVFLHHSLGQIITVVCQAAQSQSCCLLDAGDHIQHQGTEQGHDTWEERRH